MGLTDDEPVPELAEATLVSRAQDGDTESFEILVRRYQAPIFRLAYRLVFDRGEAEDATQDTLVQAWRRLPTLSAPAAFRGWIYRIATRRCMNVLRLRARRRTESADDEALVAARPVFDSCAADDPAAVAQRAVEVTSLEGVLRTLPEDQRACWVLRELHELSYAEIAYATGLPVATVRGRIARARQNLVEGMESWR